MILSFKYFNKNSEKRKLCQLGEKFIKERLGVFIMYKKFYEFYKLKYLLFDFYLISIKLFI